MSKAINSFLGIFCVYRITSYNVCYTKLLREGSTCGELLTNLAPHISHLCADYHCHLPDSADELLQYIQHHSRLTLAIGNAKDQHYPIALWDGLSYNFV